MLTRLVINPIMGTSLLGGWDMIKTLSVMAAQEESRCGDLGAI